MGKFGFVLHASAIISLVTGRDSSSQITCSSQQTRMSLKNQTDFTEKQPQDDRDLTQVESLPENEAFEPSLEERRLVQKLDRRILPICCFLALFSCASSRCLLLVVS